MQFQMKNFVGMIGRLPLIRCCKLRFSVTNRIKKSGSAKSISELLSSRPNSAPLRFDQVTQELHQRLRNQHEAQIAAVLQRNFQLIQQEADQRRLKNANAAIEATRSLFATIVPPDASSLFLNLPTEFKQPVDARCCVVSVMGFPNAGKSTIMNHLIGKKVSAVSSKAQTTRNQVLAVKTMGNIQMLFIDTPGIPTASERAIVPKDLEGCIWESCTKADILIYVVDLTKQSIEPDIERLQRIRSEYPALPIALVLNKTDKAGPERTERLQRQFLQQFRNTFKQIFFTVGMNPRSLEPVLDFIVASSVPRAWEYPPINDALLSKNERAIEIIRDKIFKRCNQEIPYSTNLVIESWNETEQQIAILCYAFVARTGQKIQLLGKEGENLQFIRTKSIEEMEKIFSKRVKLFFEIKITNKK